MFHKMMNYGELEPRPSVIITKDLIKKNLPKFKRHDDLVIIHEHSWNEFKKSMPMPVVKDENSPFSIDEDELASLVCQTIQKPSCTRLAIEKGVQDDDYRSPNIELLLGDNGIVTHRDNHVIYQFDVTKCMFSFGNIKEKMRMADLDCSNEIVVDLFAGIGYFSLPLLIHANAKHLYACEWNPDAIEALKKNLKLNRVEPSRYTVIEGDNRSNRPTDVAQRVILGILPSSLDWMRTALECIDKKTGAVLHCHDLVDSKPTNIHISDRQSLTDSLDTIESSASRQSSCAHASILNQSSSSLSLHSTIEKLSTTTDIDRLQSSESDKDTNSPVLLDKPAAFSATSLLSHPGEITNPNISRSSNDSKCMPTQNDHTNFEESFHINDCELNVLEMRAATLISCIKEDLDAHGLEARLLHIQPIKSYAPHVSHIVFDICIEPEKREQT